MPRRHSTHSTSYTTDRLDWIGLDQNHTGEGSYPRIALYTHLLGKRGIGSLTEPLRWKLAPFRLPVFGFSRPVKGCKGHKTHRFEHGGTNQFSKCSDPARSSTCRISDLAWRWSHQEYFRSTLCKREYIICRDSNAACEVRPGRSKTRSHTKCF